MQNRVWHLLREAGPDTGFLAPTTGDFSQAVVQRDLNIMLGQFISASGLAPNVCDKWGVFPVFPVLDYPLPPDLQSLTNIEYTPAGQQTYTLYGKSFSEFNAYWNNETLASGRPYCYREPWAGYIRLFPQPGPGQAYGPGIGTITFGGTVTAGNTVTVTVQNTPAAAIIVPAYTVAAADTLDSIAQNVATLINNSNAVVGPTPFLQPCGTADNQIQLTGLNPPGTNIAYSVTLSAGATITVVPNALVYFKQNGDTMTIYYSGLGSVMFLPNDSPGIPPQFHMAIVYGVLSDYFVRKSSPEEARYYAGRFQAAVEEAKKLEWNVKRSSQPTTAGYFDNELDAGSGAYY